MVTRKELLQSIASTIADYRKGEIPEPDADHVDKWIQQFDANVQLPILSELDHVFKRVYISRATVDKFLANVATSNDLTGGKHPDFWASAGLLNIQGAGASQREMLDIFDDVLQKNFGFGVEDCTASSNNFVYLDDGIFSGSRARRDLVDWVEKKAPKNAVIHVISMVLYNGGEWYVRKGGKNEKNRGVENAAKTAGKNISLKFLRAVELENYKSALNNSDVLAPTSLPNDESVRRYAQQLKEEGFQAQYRTGSSIGRTKIFSSPAGRILLEQEFLKAGVHIREICPNLSTSCRPLGFTGLRTFGFGSLVVTHRNCPNNCPLPFWVAAPWYPLFPRKTNTETGMFDWDF
jgi:hypothetical protein